jgi:choline dehydrogenase-like flavoprotein
MIVDAATPERSAFEGAFDACVIGSGPAGITLARALAAKGHRVALMEAGGLEWSPESQELYEGEVVGADLGMPLDAMHLRYFGGTSNHWNGVCAPLPPQKFGPRPSDPLSGWPIDHEDLAPYQAETESILDTEPEHATPRPAGAGPDDPFRPAEVLRSPPTRFAAKYHDEIAASDAIVLGLHANLVDLRLYDDLARVTEAHFRSLDPDDPGFAVRARVFCLCAGGIENPRLLLNFRDQIPTGIGNEHDLVGRHFSDHQSLQLGELIFAERPPADLQFFFATDEFMAAAGSLDFTIRVNHRPRQLSFVREGLRSAQCLPLVDRLAGAVLETPARCDTGGLGEYWMSRDPERYPWATVSTHSAQAMHPDNRVTLGEEHDALGLLRSRLEWQVREADVHSLKATAMGFAAYVADVGLGRMRLYDWILSDSLEPPDVVAEPHLGRLNSYHHMCTTRMSDDPREGVVDANCRVHSVENLYIGGSSVFGGPGWPPTFTIVQLALRLADHVDGALSTA